MKTSCSNLTRPKMTSLCIRILTEMLKMLLNKRMPKKRMTRSPSCKIKIKIKNKKNSRRRTSSNQSMTCKRRRCRTNPKSNSSSLNSIVQSLLQVNRRVPALPVESQVVDLQQNPPKLVRRTSTSNIIMVARTR